MKNSLTVLNLRLLLQTLEAVPHPELHALVIQQSQAAAAQAQSTPFPELVLPCLFEELVSNALSWQKERERLYWRRMKTATNSAWCPAV